MSTERKAISALKWASFGKLVVQVLSWAGTLIVVRLLLPEDYGLMAKAMAVCAIATAIAELGLGAAIVRWNAIGPDELRKLYGVSLLFGAVITVSVAAAAPLFAKLFHEARLVGPIVISSLNVILGAVAVIPASLATRELSFRPLAMIDIGAGFASIVVTLVLALLGGRVWALVLGTLCGTLVRSAALLWIGGRIWPSFSLRGIGEHLKFGLTVAGNRLSYFIVVQSDVLIGSAFLSTSAIGQYSVAQQLATLPMAKVMGTINQVALPTVARTQDDPARVRENLLKSIGLMSFVAFPAIWGISAVAPELVRVLLGQQWLPAVPALTILPLVVPIRMVCSVLFTASLALGNRQLDLRNTIVNLVALPGGFFIGAQWGLVGLCLAWLVSVPVAYAFSIPRLLRLLGLRWRAVLAEIGAPVVAAAAMYAAVALCRYAFTGYPDFVTLVVNVVAGALVYFAVIALISRQHLVTARRFTRSFFSSGSAVTASPPGTTSSRSSP